MMSRVTGSTSTFSTAPVAVSMIWAISVPFDRTDQQAATGMDGGRVARKNEGGGVHLGDDRRTGDHVAGQQLRPVVHGRLGGRPVDVDGRRGADRRARVGA